MKLLLVLERCDCVALATTVNLLAWMHDPRTAAAGVRVEFLDTVVRCRLIMIAT